MTAREAWSRRRPPATSRCRRTRRRRPRSPAGAERHGLGADRLDLDVEALLFVEALLLCVIVIVAGRIGRRGAEQHAHLAGLAERKPGRCNGGRGARNSAEEFAAIHDASSRYSSMTTARMGEASTPIILSGNAISVTRFLLDGAEILQIRHGHDAGLLEPQRGVEHHLASRARRRRDTCRSRRSTTLALQAPVDRVVGQIRRALLPFHRAVVVDVAIGAKQQADRRSASPAPAAFSRSPPVMPPPGMRWRTSATTAGP